MTGFGAVRLFCEKKLNWPRKFAAGWHSLAEQET
jgi:hypothetical protein